ncbi:MAG: SDR family oxidoreductase [Fermentimonas sp.]|nr:SDR family oxidoreductase [Fermentimonas sp.]MDD4283414.1 SDR family oxidoreductase [Fermentimonas sp.]MDD4723704.1 SDR family oxidoreductase [Fermentimonas sp.]
MEFNLQGKTAIIGGSSKGLGKACAIALAREGVNIVLCARNSDALNQTQKEIESFGVGVLSLSVDMANVDDNKRIVDEAANRFGGVDILVNNSGGPKPGTFRDITEDDLDDAYNSVLKYNIRMINLCLPYMEKKGWGRIINIASVTVKEPAPNMVLSNIFRSAVASYAKTISKELISKGVTINTVCPGYFKTDRVTQLIEVRSAVDGISVEEYEQKAIQDFPHKRYMDPQELGDLVCYLCSDQARSVNGTTIQIDGGLLSGLL